MGANVRLFEFLSPDTEVIFSLILKIRLMVSLSLGSTSGAILETEVRMTTAGRCWFLVLSRLADWTQLYSALNVSPGQLG